MAELLVRASSQDGAVLDRLLSRPDGSGLARIVLDAHAAPATVVPSAARSRGVPLLIDPQTFFLQDYQHPDDAWAKLTFAQPEALKPLDLLTVGRADRLVEESLQFQVDRGATELICPYVHIERADDGWAEVQSLLWARTAAYLDRNDLAYRIIAPFAVSWSLLRRPALSALARVLGRKLRALSPDEIAFAASKVDQGVTSADRLADFISAIRRLRQVAPVIAWQQGSLGEAAVAAGALGYECGIGWREKCQLRSAAAAHRSRPETAPHIGARPTYIDALMRSLPRPTLTAVASLNALSAELTCLRGDCCPAGRHALTRDGREHSVLARARSLRLLDGMDSPRWRWADLERRADRALVVAEKINALADRTPTMARVDTRALEAISIVARDQKHYRTRAA